MWIPQLCGGRGDEVESDGLWLRRVESGGGGEGESEEVVGKGGVREEWEKTGARGGRVEVGQGGGGVGIRNGIQNRGQRKERNLQKNG